MMKKSDQLPSTHGGAAHSLSQSTIEHKELAAVGARMQSAWSTLVEIGNGQLPRPSTLSTQWGLNQTLCTRLLQALRESDPVHALSKFPSTGSLKGVLKIAESKSTPHIHLENAGQAINELEALIAQFGGTKSNLDTMISRQLDHSREKIEQNSKQLIFRGMTSLLGVEAKSSVIMCFAFPASDPDRVDELVVHGYHGLRRLRPELPLMLGTREMLPNCEDPQAALLNTLHGGNIDVDGETTALLEFSTDPFPEIEIRQERDRLIYALSAQPEQIGGELDLFFASMHRNADPRNATPGHPRARYAYIPHNPARQLVFDVFVHKDLWQGVEPELILAKVGNPAAPDLLAHSLDRLDTIETLQNLGSSLSALSTPHFGRYRELVESVHTQMQWELSDFRVYRCSVKYAVVGLWYTIQFQLPEK